MEQMNVIARQTDPTDWVSSMVTIVKPDKIRICLDPQDLNKAIKREHYPLLTVEEVVSNMPNAKVFSVLDANQGFWQIKLDEDSSKLCTFNTPIGRYRFLRLPFGISSASEVFQRAVVQMIEDLDGVINIVDDLLVWGETVREHDARLKKLLQRAREYNLKLNKKKCQIRTSQIKYIGHVLTAEGLKPDEEKVRAVVQLPPPEDKQALQRFLGMLQYLAKFIPNLSEVSAPVRQLLEKDAEWFWGNEQEKSFQKLKALATNAPTLKYYNVNKPLTLSVDASSEGMGAVLLQDQRPVAYGSRALTDCQRRYAQIEKELLAIVYGCEKFHQYVYGREVQVESDHKPLESIFKKPLHQTPLRLQRMLLRLQRYNLKVMYKPGKEMHIADALSRAYLEEHNEDLLEEELEVNCVTPQLPVSEKKLEEFRKTTAEDLEMQKLKDYILKGWPTEKSSVHKDIHKYWTFKEEISYASGLMFKASKLIIPSRMRKEMLDKIHESHLGMVKSKERARDIIYWPGMSVEIEKMISQCATCNTHRNSHAKEPLIPHALPERPWAKVGTDLFQHNGSEYLMCVDYYSKFPEIAKLNDTTSKSVILALKSMFSRHGIADVVISDNGPQYASQEFKRFAENWEFEHKTSSPRYAQSNGQAERMIQTIKRMPTKSQSENGDPYIALLEYRNTPLDGIGMSPAQLLMGRRLKTKLPTSSKLLTPKGSKKVQEQLKQRQLKQKMYYDKNTKQLPEISPGDKVRVQQGQIWNPATVLRKHDLPRSYVLRTSDGKIYRRNRKHLLKTKEQEFPSTNDKDDFDTESNASATLEREINPDTHQECSTDGQIKPNIITRSGREVKIPSRFRDYKIH
ncbi:Retrovirus-related Pol polyprotein from transposon opus [Triplophysa tibetana]|uniref:Gypsy retrotransposon integrase-like protein 1 n=1 Tax=Triplophysa tibetana TaxID=1572043 RepID=A0A5A9NZC8_9TELE|nr:Retrovirus-related Pol polyprotein from transposon opus [Triplophysa tibetana]